MEEPPEHHGQGPRRLVGRESELATLSDFLGGARRPSPSGSPPAPSCLVLAGDAGVGKTALWQAGLELATGAGWHVLSTRASQGEAGLLFAALADLVEGIDAAVLAEVPDPQRHALEVALRRVPFAQAPSEPFAVASGFLAAIRALVTATRTLIAVDDVQWLDPSSAECLLFLARRLSVGQVAFLLSRRSHEPSGLERALEPLGVERLDPATMSIGAISRMLSDRFGLALPRRVLRQLYATSQGNPLFALELGRAIKETGVPEIGTELRAALLVDEAVGTRVANPPAAIRRALLAVALSAGLQRAELATVVDPLALEDALEAGLLVADRTQLRPGHPMLAAAARQQSSAGERQELHLGLARAIADPVLSARHLALGSLAPEREVAATVAAASQLAVKQGAFAEAEELSAHALRLTPPGAPEHAERLLELARCQLDAGDPAGAKALLDGRLGDLPAGEARARGHLLLGEASDGPSEETHLDLAIAEAGEHSEVLAVALARKAVLLALWQVARLADAEELVRRAWATASSEGNDEVRALPTLIWTLAMQGRPVEELASAVAAPPLVGNLFESSADRPLAVRLAFRGELEAAAATLDKLAEASSGRGEPRSHIGFSIHRCELALRAGDVAAVLTQLEDLEQWNAISEMRMVNARLHTLVAALSGRGDEARRWASSLFEDGDPATVPMWDQLETARALGLAALLEGDVGQAVMQLGRVWVHCEREGVDDPGAFPVAGDLVEALLEAGKLDEAQRVTARLERLSLEQQHPWGLATTQRAKALFALAGGEPEQAASSLLAAAVSYLRLGLEFDRARCLLALGRLRRRQNQRAGARSALTEAAGIFDRLGASGWAGAARAETARLGGRQPRQANALTPSEQRVAELAASGMSNKEIARTLVVTVYTVEAHLTHAFAKLGVQSRSQLSGRLEPH